MALHGSTMDALLSWVNSLKVDEPVERLSQLQDLSILIKVVSKLHVYLPGKYRNRSKSNGNAEETTRVLQQPLEDRLKFLCNFLQRYCRYGSSAENLVQWQKILHGENVEVEISKVIVLLLYYSNMKSRNLKELDDFDHKTQTELASILRFVLDNEEDLSQNDKLIHFLQRKGTAETRTPNARFPSSSDLASSSDESMSPNVPTKRRTEVRFLELHRVASSSAMKSLADAPSSPMIEVLHMPQFQMRRLKKQLTEEREFRDELELELSENKKRLAEKDAQLFLMQQRIERLVVLNEKQAEQQEPKELEELREKNESLMIRLRDTLKQCQDMKTDKTQLERKNDQLSEENGDLSYKVRDLSSRLVQLQEALNETSEEHELSLAAWQQRQSLLENELNVAINEKKYLEEQILILQGKISMLEEQLKKLGESHSLEKGESMGDILKLESLQQEVVTLTAKLVELQAQISQLQEEKRAATEEFEFQRSQFESEKLQLQEIVTNLQTSLSEITFQKERQDQEARAQEEKLMCQITTLKLEISKMKTTLMQKEEQLLGLHREVELERRQKGELMETLKKQEESSKQSMKALGDQVDHLGSVLKQSEGKVVELTQRLEAEAQQMARFQEECKKHVNERDSTLTMFNEYKSAKVEELESLNNTVHALEQNLQTNVATIEELKREKTELSVKVQELDATILDLIAKCQNLDAENDTQSKAHASALEALKSQLIEQESQLRVYEQKVALMGSVTEENTLLKEQLASLEDTVRVLKGHLENERAKYATSVEREGKTTSKLEEDLKKLSESRDQALVELQEEKANGRRLESRLRDLEEEYRVGVESFQAKLTETTAGIEQQHAKQEELALEVNKWKGIYEETKQGIAQSSCMMEEQIETVKKDYTEVSQQLEKERTRASELEAQLANATSAHSEAVSKLKTELSAALNCVKEKEVEEQKLLRAIQSAEEKLKLSQQEATERISHMESSLSNSAQDLQRISRELSEEKNRKLELEAKVKQLEDQKSEKTAALESEMTSVQAAVRERESEARKLSEEVSLLKKQLEESRLKHQEELNERNKVIKQREEERERAAGDLAAEKAAKAEVEAQLQKSLDTHKSEFTSLQNELSRSLDLIAVKESELERLAKEVSLREDQLQQQQQKVSVLANEVTALKALEVKSSTQEEEIKRYTQNVKSMEVEITALKTSICEKEREVERSQNDLAVKERENSSIREQYQTALGEVQALRPSVADLMKKCSEQDELIVLAHKEAADAKALASEKASVSERQREGIEGLEAKIQQEQQKTRELLKQLEDSRSCETERESSLEALKKELFHKVQELEQSQKALNDSSRELSSALSETQQKGKSLTEAEEQIAVCRAEIERKTGEMSVLQAEVKSLTERLASNEKSCVEFKDQLASERNKSAMLEDGLKKLQAQLDASSKELAEKQGALQRVQSEALSFKETAEKQSVSVEELQKKLTSQNEVKEGLESEIRAWKEKFDQREEQMSRLQNQLSGSQNVLEELASLKNSYQELKAQRLVMEEKHGEELEEHQKRAECLRAELEKAKGEISELMELKDTLGRRELLLQTLQAEKAGYLTQIAELQQANGALSHLSDQGAKKLEAELSKITNQHTQEVQALRRQYEKAISEGKEEAQELGQKLQAVTSKYDHAKTRVLDERQKFQEEKQKLLLQVEQLETAKKDQSEQVQELSQKLNQQEKTIRTQQQKLKLRESEVREEVDGKQKRVAELETQLEQQMQAVEHYKSQMEKARVHYDAKKAQNQELSDELQKVLREQEPLRKEHAELKTECERLGKELQHSLLQNKETEQSCKNLTAQVRTLEAQVEYADRQLRELGKFQVATDAMKSRETLCPSRVIRQSHADVSIDSLDMSDEEEHPMNSTGKNGRSHQGPAASSGSLESLASGRLPRKVESLESLYFTPIPTRAQSKLDSSIGSIGDLSLDSSKKTRSARRRTTQIINITMTKKTKEEPESANTSFYSLRSALSHQSLHPEKLQRSGRPQPAVSAPALSSLPSQESLLRPEHTSSDDSLNNSVLMNLPGYRPTTRSSTRLSQAGGRNSFYMGTCQDEPDPQEDWNRIAELQLRNRACPPHLKTSYPLESRPSLLSATITDDEVKMGDPKETLRRATLLPSQIQESTTRRMTLASSGIDHSWGSNVLTRQQQRKRVSEESHQGPDTPESKKSASCFPRPMTPKDKHDARKLSTAESKSNVNPQLTQSSRRQTMSFNILNTPKKLGSSLLRRGLGKKTPTPKNSPRAQGGRGNTGSTSTKSPLHTIRKSPSRKSPRVSKTKSPRTSSKFFERKQTRNK
ncbi:nuclear mitotic apparatus protein 1 isoform X1 [Spea bombifrons]|uniref:nuclear mitotic apparatus protein 1 isoform X1 n=1 Tax=Spea bombifrons TaxID=233779 RepID=UPI00234B9D18|nr:nuclear mitotic apparatus protein 1 isoform X1 [Spea bombifrons]